MSRGNSSPYNTATEESDTDWDDNGDDQDFEEFGPVKEAVVVFLDVDSFDVQVRGRKEGISADILKTEPFVVVNEFKVITAVNYPAKDFAIRRTKECTLEIARRMCPELKELIIPNHYGKPDSLELKKASDEIYESVVNSLQMHCDPKVFSNLKIEKASKDEFFIDVTEEVFHRVHKKSQRIPTKEQVSALAQSKCFLEAPGYSASGNRLSYRTQQVLTNDSIIQDRHQTEALLMHGAAIAYSVLQDIRLKTGYILSAGVSSNKLLAKIGCGYHKPEAITVLPQTSLGRVSKNIDVKDIPGLGGALGEKLMKRGIQTMSQLAHRDRISLEKLMRSEQGRKFHQLAIGFDAEKVVAKKFSSSQNCGITFSYMTRKLRTPDDFLEHLKNRFMEMREHLIYECNRHGPVRVPKSLRLEVCTRKRSLKTAFGETVVVSDGLQNCILSEATAFSSHYSPSMPIEWKMLYENFIDRLKENCKINVLDDINFKAACAAVRKVSAINLRATFCQDEA